MSHDHPALDLRAVFREHHDFVWRNLRALGVEGSATDDATQEVFLVVHRRRHDYRPDTPITAWLFGIVRRVAARHRQRHARARRRRAAAERPLVDPGLDPEQATERAVAARRVAEFLGRLDDEQRQVFVLTEVQGLTGPEVAALVGAEVNTVYSRLRLARRKLAAFIGRHRARQERRHARSR